MVDGPALFPEPEKSAQALLLQRLRVYFDSHALPPGAAIDAASLAVLFGADSASTEAALKLLADDGYFQNGADGSLAVSTEVARLRRDLAARIGPVLVGMARIAAVRAEAADVLAMQEARNRMDKSIAVLDAVGRGRAYRDCITALAAATHNGFYTMAAAQLLREGSQMIDALMLIDLKIFTSNSEDGEFRRLVEAVAAGNPEQAAQAAQDHALIITHRLDGL